MPEIRYRVSESTTAVVRETDPIDIETVPCWNVTRTVDGFGWHIGKYRTPAVAEAVADALAGFSSEELA
jgi:hypothetical protein